MATRATYEICGTTFYCHWDGYPTGAAQRFAAMVKAMIVADESEIDGIERRNGGYAFAFIRGVMDAESTEGHEAHGDTEYRYTLDRDDQDGMMIRVEERLNFGNPAKRETWAGKTFDLADWLNKMRGELVAQIKRMQARYPTGPMSSPGDADEMALESIPVVVKIAVQREYCKTPDVTYATAEQAGKIAKIYASKAEKFQDDNPNKAIYARKAQAWSDAAR